MARSIITKRPGIVFIIDNPSLISLPKEFLPSLLISLRILGALSFISGGNAIKKVTTSIHKIYFIGKKNNNVAPTAGPTN
jgi:hypothetical protein